MREEKMLTFYCPEDDTTLRANSEDELVRMYRDHMRSTHGEIISQEEARQEVEESLQETREEES